MPTFFELPETLHRNRLPPTTLGVPYADIASAVDETAGPTPYHHLLNGRWEFLLVKGPLQAPAGWQDDTANAKFGSIVVPSSWQMEGHGQLQYVNITYPIPFSPPHVPLDNPTGLYRRRFRLPGRWMDRRVHLRFGGVDSAAIVFVNGIEVGATKGSHLPAEFDISSAVRFDDENRLAVMVPRFSDGTYLEDQDKWRLSGIFRDVELIARAQDHLEDVHIRTIALDPECRLRDPLNSSARRKFPI